MENFTNKLHVSIFLFSKHVMPKKTEPVTRSNKMSQSSPILTVPITKEKLEEL